MVVLFAEWLSAHSSMLNDSIPTEIGKLTDLGEEKEVPCLTFAAVV